MKHVFSGTIIFIGFEPVLLNRLHVRNAAGASWVSLIIASLGIVRAKVVLRNCSFDGLFEGQH